MALFISEKNGIIEVREEIHSFKDTKRSWSYYDLSNNLTSSHGKQGDALDRPLDAQMKAWAQQHYVPRIAPYVPTPQEHFSNPQVVAEYEQSAIKQARIQRQAVHNLLEAGKANSALPFEEKCRLMKEETGYSVKDHHTHDSHKETNAKTTRSPKP